jgi:hypothetical protein
VTLGKSVWLPWRVFVMPGSTIGDGSVIGANSLVSGTIPPYSLALGTPAKVIKQAPEWPRKPTASEQAAMVANMVAEFDRFAAYKGVTITDEPPFRVYSRGGNRYRLLWLRTDDASAVAATVPGDTVLVEAPITMDLASRNVYWLDLAGRTRSPGGSPLTEELAIFIRRYGIRLPRE